MNAVDANDWSIDFNFHIPKKYHRKFMLQDGDCLLTLEVKGRRCSLKSVGGCGASRLMRTSTGLKIA